MSHTDNTRTSKADGPKCPSCRYVLSQKVLKLFDPHSNRIVQLFQCSNCRKHVWEDDAG